MSHNVFGCNKQVQRQNKRERRNYRLFSRKINWHLQYQESNWALSKEELVPFEKLLSEIESDDILIKNKYLFENFLIKTPDYKDYDNDFLKKIRKQEKPELKLSNK